MKLSDAKAVLEQFGISSCSGAGMGKGAPPRLVKTFLNDEQWYPSDEEVFRVRLSDADIVAMKKLGKSAMELQHALAKKADCLVVVHSPERGL